MKLIINASTLSGTGVSQVAVSFINECIYIKENEYHVFVSKTIEGQLDIGMFPGNFFFYKIKANRLYNLKGFKERLELKKKEIRISPDCVFTISGPSWWTPLSPHLQGFAYGHYIYNDSPFFERASIKLKLKFFIFKKIHTFFLKKNGSHYVSETNEVTNRLKYILKRGQYYTVGNTYNSFFNSFIPTKKGFLKLRLKNEFRFLSPCAFDDHKNLTILNEVIPLLNKKKNNIKFVLTIDNDIYEKKFNSEVKESIVNLGRQDINKCPQLYHECDALFLPTTIECFTVNYPEAMKMKKPIITSDLSFATSICKDSAIYFDPYDPIGIAKEIMNLVLNPKIREELIIKGEKRLLDFITAKERAKQYLEICKEISKNK